MATKTVCDNDGKTIEDYGMVLDDLRDNRTFAMGPAVQRNFCNEKCVVEFLTKQGHGI